MRLTRASGNNFARVSSTRWVPIPAYLICGLRQLGSGRSLLQVEYRFQTPGREALTGRAGVPLKLRTHLTPGTPVVVLYDPEQPRRSTLVAALTAVRIEGCDVGGPAMLPHVSFQLHSTLTLRGEP